MKAEVYIEEVGHDVGFCLSIKRGWTRDTRYAVAVREENSKMDARTLVCGLRQLASVIEEDYSKEIDQVITGANP